MKICLAYSKYLMKQIMRASVQNPACRVALVPPLSNTHILHWCISQSHCLVETQKSGSKYQSAGPDNQSQQTNWRKGKHLTGLQRVCRFFFFKQQLFSDLGFHQLDESRPVIERGGVNMAWVKLWEGCGGVRPGDLYALGTSMLLGRGRAEASALLLLWSPGSSSKVVSPPTSCPAP